MPPVPPLPPLPPVVPPLPPVVPALPPVVPALPSGVLPPVPPVPPVPAVVPLVAVVGLLSLSPQPAATPIEIVSTPIDADRPSQEVVSALIRSSRAHDASRRGP